MAGVVVLAAALGFSVAGAAEESSSLFWPPPPADMRIVFEQSIRSPRDIGVRPGVFQRVRRWFTGEEERVLSRPSAVAVDREGVIYVADPGASAIHIFDPKKKRYRKISTVHRKNLVSPVGVAVDKSGDVFIADSGMRKVFCLDRRRRWKWTIGDDQDLLRPTGMVTFGNRLYVVDTTAHHVKVFDLKGNRLRTFGQRGKSPGEFNYPTTITRGPEGDFYVVDTLNFRVQVFDGREKFLYSIGQAGDSFGSFGRPKGVAVDSFGHIYVTDGLADNIQVFNRNNVFLLSLGRSGDQPGEFWMASGLAITEDNYIYVADPYNHRLQVFRYVGKD